VGLVGRPRAKKKLIPTVIIYDRWYKLFFFEKKNQKTFDSSGPGTRHQPVIAMPRQSMPPAPANPRSEGPKIFWFFFFKKEPLSLEPDDIPWDRTAIPQNVIRL
jgi:hypothetical protein